MHKSRKVLVTGANGLLGANTICHLISRGFDVIAMVRKGSNRAALKDIECRILEGNICSFNDIELAVKECDYVIHCAARTKQFPNKWDLYMQANITSTAMLIECCKKYNIKRFIHVSSVNCFTNGTIQNPGNESGSFLPWLTKSGYAYSKYIAQQMVLEEAKTNGFPAIVVAPGFLIGARDSRPSSGRLLLYGLKNRVVFYTSGGKNFVDADLAAEAIVNSLSKGKLGECYLLAGKNLSYRSFFKEIRSLTGKWQLQLKVPTWLILFIAKICSFLEDIFRISLPLNTTNQRLVCLDNFFSNNKAIQELGMKQTSISQALYKSAQWFRSNSYL